MRQLIFALSILLVACKHAGQSTPTVTPTGAPQKEAPPSVHGGGSGLPAGKIIDAKTGKEVSFDEMISQLSSANEVYVGEVHDDRLQHEAQLWVLKGLFYKRPGQVAVGMEMFQRPFQSVLDLYLEGEIGEKALIRESQYESRWGYDFSYYRGIMRFALDHQVPVIALNAPTEWVKKISSVGLEGLTPEEKKALPELDLTDEVHKARIKAVFDAHPHGKNFDRFYTIQTLWDETMAETISNFLKPLADQAQMVVFAGHGHTDTGTGIPKRVNRRLPGAYKIVVPISIQEGEEVNLAELQKEGLGDYLWLLTAPKEGKSGKSPHGSKN